VANRVSAGDLNAKLSVQVSFPEQSMKPSQGMLLNCAILAFALIAPAGNWRLNAQNQPKQQPPAEQPDKQKAPFDDRAATGLLTQLTRGMEENNQRQVLAAFDFVHMPEGELFQQQLISFLSHAEGIRMHVNLLKAASDADKATVEAEMEMEIEPRDGSLPVRKRVKVNFVVQSTPAGWKFVDVKPR
jgi:hypothetical protein